MPIDFSDFSDLIPDKTIAVVQMRVRLGDGTDGVLKCTKGGDGEGLDAEFTLLEGPHARRKFFSFMLVKGETDGQKQMCDRNLALIKAMIDSAKFLDPGDRSPEARAKRTLNFRDLSGIRFLAQIGIEPGRDGFPDRNGVQKIITKDKPEWNGRPPIDQDPSDFGGPPPAGPGGAPPANSSGSPPIVKPAWAK